MREWQGRRDDLSVIAEEGLHTAQNVSYKVTGEIRRRSGLSGRIDQSGTLVTEWTDPFGTPYLVYNTGSGGLRTVKISDGTETAVATGLSTARGCFSRSNGRLYFVNDFNAMQRVSTGDQATTTAGINAPLAAIGTPTTATGLCTAGVHGMRYRYFDSKSLYMSDPSDQTNITLAGAGTSMTFSIFTSGTTIIRSTDAKVDQIIIELTDAGSSTFYRAATVNQTLTGTSISMNDVSLRLQVPAARDGDFNHQPPPLAAMLVEHRGRLFAFGAGLTTVTGVTVSTASSATITVTGSTFSSGWAGRLVKVGSDTKFYRVAAMSGTGLAQLSETYTGTAGVATGVQFFSATPDMLYWSRAGFPESWNTINFARRVLQNTADAPSGIVSHHDVLYLCGQRTIRMMDYPSDPSSGQLIQIPTEMGLWNQHCIVEANGRIYGWGRSGVWTVNGLIPKHLSKTLDAHIDGSDTSSDDLFDVSKFEQFHGIYDPRERIIMWFYCTADENFPKHAIVYDVDNQQWSISTWKMGMEAATMVTGGATNPTRALLADEWGYSWYVTPDVFDGVPAVMSGGALTVSSTGSTTTVIEVSQSLPTGTPDLVGVIAVYSGQERRITANTANTITLALALSAAPTIGSQVLLGGIDVDIRTKWIVFDGFKNKKRPSYLMLALVPGSFDGVLYVQIFLDYSPTPFVYTKNDVDTDPKGAYITSGSATVEVDLVGFSGEGVVFVPLPFNWHRVISARIFSDYPEDLLQVLDYDWIFKDQRQTAPMEGD